MKKSFFFSLITLLVLIFNTGKAQIINTIAGGFKGDGSTAFAISINPINQAIDASGNIIISDPSNGLVRKLSVNGIYTIVAGTGILGFSGDGGPANSAQVQTPYNVAVDKSGNIYIDDSYENRIRKVTTSGIITTVAGNGTSGFSGDGGQATSAQLNGPNAITVDISGNIFIADFSNNRVRKVDINGIITTVAGNGNFGMGGDGGPATAGQFNYPIGVATNAAGELFITDLFSNKIRKVNTNGIITTIAGNGNAGFSGDGGLAISAQLNNVAGSVAIDADGNIFIPDSRNNRIRKVNINGIITTVAGNGSSGFSGDGSLAINAEIYNPTGISVDPGGNVFISSAYRIRKVLVNGIINTIAGNGSPGYSGDNGPATSAQLYDPSYVAVDKSGNIYVPQPYDSRVRKISIDGVITTFAGTGIGGFTGDGGPAISANLSTPGTVAVDKNGNIYIGDYGGDSRLRKVSTNGTITTIAGNGVNGFSGDNGPAISAQFSVIAGIGFDVDGNIYLADRVNARVRKITTDGIVTTVAGNGIIGFSGDGGPATQAEFGSINSLAVDASGNIYIADGQNYRVRKVSTDGTIRTIAGNGNSGLGLDGGLATSTPLSPSAVAIDSSGNIFITEFTNNRVRKINPSGIVSTIAGGGSTFGDGGLATSAQLSSTSSIAVDVTGNIFINDLTNNRIRKISLSTLPLTLLQFDATLNNKNILTAWQTTNEVNTSKFSIQRSLDGISFLTIGNVSASTNNSNYNDYHYIDSGIARLNNSVIYYRLLITDNDDRKTYSKIVTVKLKDGLISFNLSPNPAHEIVYVKGENIQQIVVTDLNGKILIRQNITGNFSNINIPSLAKGMYIFKAYNNQKQLMHFEKLLIQ